MTSKPKTTETDIAALGAAIRGTADPASSPFAHLRGVKLGDPRYRALIDWCNTVARAELMVAANEREQATRATAAAIHRAAAIARGEVTPLPVDETARAIIRSGRVRRGEREE
jgi:hypothetical protein